MTKDEALQMCLEYIETNAHERKYVRHAIKQARSAPVCNPHPKAPHGFNRNVSHSADRYVCECEGWDAYDAGYQAGIKDTYKSMDALDKMADNARELGLDYEPAPVQPVAALIDENQRLRAELKFNTLPAQPAPVQDVDWKDMYEKEKRRSEMWVAKYEKDIGPLEYAVPVAAPVQEPVAWMQDSIELYVQDRPNGYYTIPLYTTPPAAQRQWVGLTDEQIDEVCAPLGFAQMSPREVARAIEAKLKEKNT